MRWTQKIYSTLQTWVFKRKLLKFSTKFKRDPQACFYCPEMCRFSCPVAETLKMDSVTPRGKMSLLHLREKELRFEQLTGDQQSYEWFLDQCTGCGRCTEYCKHEVDVAENLRAERQVLRGEATQNPTIQKKMDQSIVLFESLQDVAFICEKGRKDWWLENAFLMRDMDEHLKANQVVEIENLARYWEQGLISTQSLKRLARALNGCRRVWVESPELGYFFAKALREQTQILKCEVRLVWQRHFLSFAVREPAKDEVLHESYYLTRMLPRLGYSIPMYERGFMPFHSGWNLIDCGGESAYSTGYSQSANQLAKRFLADLGADDRVLRKIICQNLSCVEHLRKQTDIPVVYWLDEMLASKKENFESSTRSPDMSATALEPTQS